MKRLTSRNPLTERGAMNLSLTDLYMRLKSYEDLEEKGRLIVLPCKVGDTLYEIDLPEYGVIACKVMWMILKMTYQFRLKLLTDTGWGVGIALS